MWFQSTHSLRSATQNPDFALYVLCVSIHALLAECDLLHPRNPIATTVSIHALLAECDIRLWLISRLLHSFNPRTPCGVRLPDCPIAGLFHVVSIHALLAECDQDGETLTWAVYVSIHALLAECDLMV